MATQPAGRARRAPDSAAHPAIQQPDVLDLIDKPMLLLKMQNEQFDRLVEEFSERGAPMLVALRTGAGLLAWAARHHLPDSHYGAWLHRFSQDLGVSDDSVTRWRDKVTHERNLPVPMVTQDRSRARTLGSAAAKQLRQRAVAAGATPERRAAELELGDIGSPSLQAAVAQLALTSADTLAESATTEQLRTLLNVIEEAIAHQQRSSLRARTEQANARRRPRSA